MHFLCSTYGSSGDVFPMLGLALELRQRGHEVTFATNEHYAGLAAKYGLPFEPLGTKAEFAACIGHPDLWHPRRGFAHVFQGLKPSLKRQYQIHADRAGPGVVGITNCFGFGAFMAQDKLGLPVLTLHVQPAVLWSDRQPPLMDGIFGPRWLKSLLFRIGERFFIDPVVCPFLNDWRRELGLPPIKKIMRWWNSPFGVLAMFPDWYAPPQPDWPRPLLQTDFPLWNHQSNESLAGEVDAFLQAGEPPIVFTPGSTNLHGQAFFAAAVGACQTLQRRAILLTEFPDQLPRDLPKSVAHFRYVPLDLLLSRSAAFVHHGGIGSTSQGMLAGVPQVVIPLAHDQFDNADRIRRLQLGDWIPERRLTAPRLADALRRLLASNEVATACKQAALRLTARDGLRRSADAVLERVKQPVTDPRV